METKNPGSTLTISLLIILLVSHPGSAFEQALDVNQDGRINDLDVIQIKEAIESGVCRSGRRCDVNQDGRYDMVDYDKAYSYMYGGFSQAPTATGTIDLGTSTRTQQAATSTSSGPLISLDQPFAMKGGEIAALDATDGFKIYLSGTEKMTCLKAGSCPDASAHVEMRPKDGVPRVWTIAEGHEEQFGNYKIMAKEVDPQRNSATFIVKRIGATSIGHELEPAPIRPGSPFRLMPRQTAYIEGKLKIRFEDALAGACAACPPKVLLAISLPGATAEFRQELTAGGEIVISDLYKLKLLYVDDTTSTGAIIGGGSFLITEIPSTIIEQQKVQVAVGEPFKLKTGWTAFKLGSDGFELTAAGIEPPTCGPVMAAQQTAAIGATGMISIESADMTSTTSAVIVGPAQINPAVAAQNPSAIPTPFPAMPPIPSEARAPPCRPGAVAIKTGGSVTRMAAGQTIGLTDKYTLTALEIRGMADGQSVAVMLVKDKTSEVIEIPLGAPFDIAAGQKSESHTEPYFSLTLTSINQVQCIRAPCPAHAELRLETSDRGDFEMSVAEGMISPRAGLQIEVKRADPIKNISTLIVTRTQEGGTKPMPGSDRDEHGCIGSAGYTWCESKKRCLRPFEESCDGTIDSCAGCLLEGKCLSTGVRMLDPKKDVPVYCDIDGTLSVQKETGEPCQNSYECESNTCADGKCMSLEERLGGIEKEVKEQRGILDRILGFFKSIFGLGE